MINSKDTCSLLLDLTSVLPGWGCCKCQTYNGLQRKNCRICDHECCNPKKPLPSKYGLCNECGTPKGKLHVGHLPGVKHV